MYFCIFVAIICFVKSFSLKSAIGAFATVIGSSFQFGYGNAVLNTMEPPMKLLYEDSGTS